MLWQALVNQVSGDIYRRFGDVFGVMTSDWQYRVLSCDVLITVPTSLEALLLDPERAEWVRHSPGRTLLVERRLASLIH